MKFWAGPWLPDQPAFNNPGLVRAENVVPAAEHYRSFPAASSQGVSGLSGQAEGITVGLPIAGDPVLFAGFGGSLYRIPALSTPAVNVSKDADLGYTMLPGDRWRFVQFGNRLLATNLNDPIQAFDLTNLSGRFADLPGSPPKAKYMARIRDFVVLGHIVELPDGEVPYRLRWHGFNQTSGIPDPEEWTISLETRADYQDVPDVGGMTGLTGGRFGIALFRKGIVRVDFGGQYLFETVVVDDNIGCEVPGSVVRYGTETYFWSDEGIFKTAGGPAVPVGTERVNRYLRDNLDPSRHADVWAYPDYRRGLILWLLPLTSSTNRILVYRPGVDRFSTIEVDVDSLGPTISFGLDLDDEDEFPDLDTDERDLDDPQLWTGGILGIGGQIEGVEEAYDEYEQDAGDLIIFNGDPLQGVLEWAEIEPGDGLRFAVRTARAFHDRGAAQILIGSREKLAGDGSDLVWRGPFNPQSDGWYRFMVNGRYHRLRMVMTGDWQTVRGADVRGAPLGMR